MNIYSEIKEIELSTGHNYIDIEGFTFVFDIKKMKNNYNLESLRNGNLSEVTDTSVNKISDLSFFMIINKDKTIELSKKVPLNLVDKMCLVWTPREVYEREYKTRLSVDGIWDAKCWHSDNKQKIMIDYESILNGDIYEFGLMCDRSVSPSGVSLSISSIVTSFTGDLYIGKKGFDIMVRDIKDMIINLINLTFLPKFKMKELI